MNIGDVKRRRESNEENKNELNVSLPKSKKLKPTPTDMNFPKMDENQSIVFDDDDFLCNTFFETEFDGKLHQNDLHCNGKIDDDDKDLFNTESMLNLSNWKRCIVKSIEKDLKTWNLILRVQEIVLNNFGNHGLCRLQGPWCTTKISPNEIVSIKAVWNDNQKCFCVSGESGFIVTYPDHLMSGTSVVGSLFCQRKGVLADRFTGIDSNLKIMTIGSLVHEIFQIVTKRKLELWKDIVDVSREVLSSQQNVFALYSSGMSAKETEEEVDKFLPKIKEFIDRYITGERATFVKDTFCDRIESIVDIEENVWVPMLGLKGKVDVSVNVQRRNNFFNADITRMPLEIKTGKVSFSNEHRGQVIIYQMMMSEIGQKVDSGILLYLKDGIMKEVQITRNDQRDLILLRNEIAYYLTRNSQVEYVNTNFEELKAKLKQIIVPSLPEPINHRNACGNCCYSTICTALLSRDETTNISDGNPLKLIMKQTVQRLRPEHIDYFIHWTGLLTLEENEDQKENQISRMWTDSPENRESHGKAVTNLVLVDDVICNEELYLHVFTRKSMNFDKNTQSHNMFGNVDLTLCGLYIGEYLRVSTATRFAVAAGRIVEVTKNSIKMSLERIIIERSLPTFSKTLPKIIATEGKGILVGLNKIQQKAVLKALTTNDYLLLKGLPGTGKTQTLVAIVCLYVLMGKSVIITSHTNSAVDNVLIRLLDKGLDFIRLGSSSSIMPAIKKYTESILTKNCKTPDDFDAVFKKYDIVGVTCLGSAHPLLLQRKFDICIVDEATQVMQCTIIRPLLSAEKFILVGDPEQLPPLVKSKKAKLLGADESLFSRLDSKIATAVLTMQYRMNRTITKLANQLTYDEALQCANDEISSATMKLSTNKNLTEILKSEKWLQKPLSTHLDLSVILLNTKNIFELNHNFVSLQQTNSYSSHHKHDYDSESFAILSDINSQRNRTYINYCEAAVVLHLVDQLVQNGTKGTSIGIIAPYRVQVEMLKQMFVKYETEITKRFPNGSGIEVNTVDQYQGRDKEIILYSCTKCDNPKYGTVEMIPKTTEILEDHRRLTVAITRSKVKLIMIGDVQSLQMYSPFGKLFKSMNGMSKVSLTEGHQGFQWQPIMDRLSTVLSS